MPDISKLVSLHPITYPMDFVASKSHTNVPATVAARYETDPMKLLYLPDAGSYFYPVTHTIGYAIPAGHPVDFFRKFDKVVSKDLCRRLAQAYEAIEAANIPHAKTNDSNRSATSAYHFGAWEIYARAPRITAASRPKDTDHEQLINKFTGLIHSFVSRKFSSILKTYDRQQWDLLNV